MGVDVTVSASKALDYRIDCAAEATHRSRHTLAMIWFWFRDKRTIRLETRYDNDTSEFVVVIEHPDGSHESERFADLDVFRERLVVLEQTFEAAHWTQSGYPLLAPEGFPKQRLGSESMRGKTQNRDGAIEKRTYTTGVRAFEVTLALTVVKDQSLWTVESVTETTSGGTQIMIPGIRAVVASTQNATLARACDCIDTWLLLSR